MDEVKRRDLQIFLKQLVHPLKLQLLAVIIIIFIFARWSLFLPLPLFLYGTWAWFSSIKQRFHARRFQIMWESCEDRLERLDKGLKTLSKAKIADLQELPRTVKEVADSLYQALRRADIVMHEVSSSEGWLISQSDPIPPAARDPQARALYDAAARSTMEYKDQVRLIMGGIERTEAQAAVFTSALDTLRVKMLGYRLINKLVESPSKDFMEAMVEARMQFDSIDKALDELEMTPFPKQITVMGDGTPVPEPEPIVEEEKA